MDLLHIDAVALPASVFYWTFLCLYRFLEPFLSSLIWRKRIASKCVSQRVSVRNFVRPACNTGRRRRSGQGVALTSISFLGRKYCKKISVGSTRFTYLHCVDLLFSKIAYSMTLIVSQIGSNSIERLNFNFFWNLQLLLKGQGCRPIKLYLS